MERITIDSERAPHMVKIKGSTRRSVEQARARLEYTARLVPLERGQLDRHFFEGHTLDALGFDGAERVPEAVGHDRHQAGVRHRFARHLGGP